MTAKVIPYPRPSSVAATAVMRANRKVDSKPELAIRSSLHRSGLRFRKNHAVVVGDLTVRPDVVFTAARVAVFVDGCFWHCCPQHGVQPQVNNEYWEQKLRRNRERDERVNQKLRAFGWSVVRVWEHVGIESAVNRITLELQNAMPGSQERG